MCFLPARAEATGFDVSLKTCRLASSPSAAVSDQKRACFRDGEQSAKKSYAKSNGRNWIDTTIFKFNDLETISS